MTAIKPQITNWTDIDQIRREYSTGAELETINRLLYSLRNQNVREIAMFFNSSAINLDPISAKEFFEKLKEVARRIFGLETNIDDITAGRLEPTQVATGQFIEQ